MAAGLGTATGSSPVFEARSGRRPAVPGDGVHRRAASSAAVIEREGPLAPARAVALLEPGRRCPRRGPRRGPRSTATSSPATSSSCPTPTRRDAGHAYLTDFGLTKAAGGPTAGLTMAGQFVGTPGYVAPEQIEGKDPVDDRADVIRPGLRPVQLPDRPASFAKDSEVATIYAHLQEDRPRPSVKQPHLPKVVDGVLTKAMAKRPTDRYETCGGMAEALRRAAGSVGAAPAAGPARRRLLVALAGVLVVAAVATVLVLTRTSSREGQGAAASPTLGRPAPLIRIDPRTDQVIAILRGCGDSRRGGERCRLDPDAC